MMRAFIGGAFCFLLWWADKGIEPDVIRDLKSTEQGLTSTNIVLEGERFPNLYSYYVGRSVKYRAIIFLTLGKFDSLQTSRRCWHLSARIRPSFSPFCAQKEGYFCVVGEAANFQLTPSSSLRSFKAHRRRRIKKEHPFPPLRIFKLMHIKHFSECGSSEGWGGWGDRSGRSCLTSGPFFSFSRKKKKKAP